MKRVFTLVVAALLALPFAGTPAAQAANVVSSAGDTVDLELFNGKLIKLPSPAQSVFVGNPEIADVQVQAPTVIYVFGKAPGRTNVFALGTNGQVLVNSPVHVQFDITGLNAAIADLLPDARIQARAIDGGVLLAGSVDSPMEAEDARRIAERFAGGTTNVLNRISIEGPNQVSLRVRIAEVSRSVTKQFGINWETISNFGNFTFGLASGADVIENGIVNRPGGSNALFGSFQTPSHDVNSLLDALETEGLVTTLAEPNLTAMSGETASFLAGGEFPIPFAQDQGVITVIFKEFGVSLSFTPTIVNNQAINLRVRPEVSQLSSAGAVNTGEFTIDAISTRRAETTVELGSGQSFAIAGLLQNDTNHDLNKFPFLGDVPILGALFRSDEFQRNETELVIVVTPYLVRPTSQRIALPTDGYIPPSDDTRILEHRNFRNSDSNAPSENDTAARADTQELKLLGPAGFILE